ncbi:pilus assembly protein PilM [bacterium]|nr:pilus assembly protein PilM [bacterium]
MKIGGRSRYFAIDIGNTKIRIADIEFISGKPTLTYYEELLIPPMSPEERENFIRTEGKNFIGKLPSRSGYVSLPGRGVLVRSLPVPKVPPKKLKDILKYEVQQQIPFPLEVVEWKYQIVGEEANNYHILLGAVKRELINEYMGKINTLGIDPLFLDTDLFALLNAFMFSAQFRSDKCQAILEIGASSSNFIITHGNKLLLRSLTVSGDTLTNSIVETEGISFEEAEKKKIEEGLNLPSVNASIESLHTEIQNSIDYWRFTQKGPEVEEFYLCGRTALLKGLKEFFEEKARIKTFFFSPFSNIELNAKYSDLKEREIEFAILVGIALRRTMQTFVNINLLPEEIERIREFKINRPYIYLSVAMAGLIAITPTLFYNQDKVMLRGLLNELEVSLQQYEKYKPDVDKLNSEIKNLNGKIGIIKGIIDKKSAWLKRIIEVGSALPSSRIYIISLTPGVQAVQQPQQQPQPEMGAPPPGALPPGAPPPPPGAPPGEMPPGAPGGVPQQPQQVQQSKEVKVEGGKVFTLKGEVVVTDIKTAFNDFKNFVKQLTDLEFIEKVEINTCELNKETDKIEFALLLNLK